MASDSLLDEFQLEPDVYRLGQYSPVSIRDQIVRASYLVDRLWARGRLGAGSRLLIIGAGAAGVTAAIRALSYSIGHVDLVERAKLPMPLQARCSTRTIDPVQYDWPAGHWGDKRWPVPESHNPREYTAVSIDSPTHLRTMRSDAWASAFFNTLSSHLGKTNFDFHGGVEASAWARQFAGGSRLLVTLSSVAAAGSVGFQYPVDADVIIFAGGLGIERAQLDLDPAAPPAMFHGIPFWQDDKFQDGDVGIKGGPHDGVLVSGSGDGALQDYVRLVTGLDTCAEVLSLALGSLSTPAWRARVEGLWHWEDHAQRALRHEPQPINTCTIQYRLHARYEDLVEELVKSGDWPRVCTAFDKHIANKGRPFDEVYLAYPCDHFTWCYALNRIVALLVIAYVMERSSKPGFDPRLPNRSVRATAALQHVCKDGCWGYTHLVRFATSVKCGAREAQLKAWPVDDIELSQYEGLVIRHGIDALAVNDAASRIAPQQMPFHLP